MSSIGKVLLAALAGAAVGVAAGLLIAPTSGKETIENLSQKGEELKNDLESAGQKSKKSLQELGEKLQSTLKENINGVKDAKLSKEG